MIPHSLCQFSSFRKFFLVPGLLVSLIALSGCGGGGEETSSATEKKPEGTIDFVTQVKPILQSECVRCHHDGAIMGGLNLMTRASAMKGGNKGPVIVPGDPEKSSLYRVTQLPEDQDHAMPATGAKLTDEDKAILRQWIQEGAGWPEGEAGTMQPIKTETDKV